MAENRKQVDEIFARAATDAASLIVEAVSDEALPIKQRYDAALEILNRLFGKTPPKQDEGEKQIVVRLADESAQWAK